MRIDMHAHYVPPRILEVLERDAAPYGVQVQHAEGVDAAYTLVLG